MVNVLIQNLFQSVETTMEMNNLIQENFPVMDSTPEISMMMMYKKDQEAVGAAETPAEIEYSHQLLRELNQLQLLGTSCNQDQLQLLETSYNQDQLQLLYKRLLIGPVLDDPDLKQLLQLVNLFSWNLSDFNLPSL